MSDKQHSWLPPSAAHRIVRCPGSLKASEGIEDNRNHDAADKGTECHNVMEQSVAIGLPVWSADDFTDPKEQMELCEIAWSAFEGFTDDHQPDSVEPEVVVDLKALGYEDIFGTSDVVMRKERTLFILDFKFGYNEVSPERNEQLMLYGLGALGDERSEYDTVVLAIIQPKVSRDVQSWTTTPDELMQWWAKDMLPAILDIQNDRAKLKAGEIQCKWCPVAAHGCPAQTKKYLTAIEEFNPAEAFELDDDKLTRLLVMVPAMKDAIKAVEIAGVNRLKRSDTKLRDHFKLVERQTKRRWKDKAATEAWLKSKRFKQADMYKRDVLTPAQAEKLVKTKKFSIATMDEFRQLIEKPTGELTYAPLDDKRKAVEVNETKALEDAMVDDIL